MTETVDFQYLSAFKEKMTREGLAPKVIETFSYYYKKAVLGETGVFYEKDLETIALEDVTDYETLGPYTKAGVTAHKKTVAIILNGGLGTSMGLLGPKSLLIAKNGKTFLEIIIRQARAHSVQLAFMNSFNTHKATIEAASKLGLNHPPMHFLQHKYPKILIKDFSPACWPENPHLEWNPPGHGDLYMAFSESGLLDDLIQQGIRYAFVSNCDNLGAGMDESLLGYFASHELPFMMEVSTRTPADMKGGHLARHKEGYLLLRESAQCHKKEMEAFSNIASYSLFNTNNLWLNLPALKENINTHGLIKLPMILNVKTLDPRDHNSPPVYQIESAMGSAISLFKGAAVVKVPRTRFFPVKKCNDLLAIRSDRYLLSEDQKLVLNPRCISDEIKIHLDPDFYETIEGFDDRFKGGVPSLVDCTSLSIRGDVLFEKDVTLKGQVNIVNRHSDQKVVKAGSVISGELIL
ncbi:MAG: UTP--glucose-1-phosphate uridylyltransferase [Proteobacteria bacterium]|nr:UTP--glucose-1-phosphate uridylyltransferase [Pseudomonadota bacterium]